ncbi:MAG: phosphodiester glycosidase family protein [Anaerolineae bacterium]|nr:phosphodiester glycosidase family protein [Anaerolineae bacterium]
MQRRVGWWFLGVAWLVMACSLTIPGVAQEEADTPPLPVAPLAEPQDGARGWEEVAPGVAFRWLPVERPLADPPFEIAAVRLDPQQVSLRVHYRPQFFLWLEDWRAELGNALMIVNSAFFTPEGYAVGLVISDDQRAGASLEGYGGMLQVGPAGAAVRSLVTEPYQGESYQQAVQGFPMLIHPGGQVARTGAGFDDPARRTLVAQDRAGFLYFFVTVAPGPPDPCGMPRPGYERMGWNWTAPLTWMVASPAACSWPGLAKRCNSPGLTPFRL